MMRVIVALLALALATVVRAGTEWVPPDGTLVSVVGTGAPGYSGDGGPATQARLDQPFHCAFDRRGNLYVADTFNHCIRKVDAASGTITTVAGTGRRGYSGDGGPATRATLNEPYGVLADREGNLFIVERLNAVVRRVDARTGIVTTYAGTGRSRPPSPGAAPGDGGPAHAAPLVEPNAIDFDPAGNLYIADVRDQRIRRVDRRTGTISTVAGTGRREFAGDGGPATQASINGARGVAFDRQGNMWICEREGHRIRRVDARTGIITTIAGTGRPGYTGDGGPARTATFSGPKWIHAGDDGHLYVVDTENHAIRRIDLTRGTIATVAGGRRGPGGDGSPATLAAMDRPHGCWVRRGILYTADTNNHRVRANRVAPPASLPFAPLRGE